VDLSGKPEFPFGFGLSYTRFAYSDLHVSPSIIATTGHATITLRVTNIGTQAGDEVPQLYIRDILSPIARPVLALEAFTRLHLEAGEARTVTFRLDTQELQTLNQRLEWTTEPGVRQILIGASSNDMRLRGVLEVRR
jgi:beta-glucosidase